MIRESLNKKGQYMGKREKKNLGRCFWIGMTTLSILLLFCSFAYSQKDQAVLQQKKAQAEVAADSNEYVIGPEDVLYIHVWKEGDLSRMAPVRMDGKISLPLIDDVKAEGLTPMQLKGVLIKKFQDFIDVPNISVMVMEANSFKVFISGQVRSPGVLRLRNETNILQLLVMVGGFTEWANQKKILIIRKENGQDKRILVNYKKIVDGSDSASNYVLKPNDTIIVP